MSVTITPVRIYFRDCHSSSGVSLICFVYLTCILIGFFPDTSIFLEDTIIRKDHIEAKEGEGNGV